MGTLIPKIIHQGKSRIYGSLGKGSGNGKFGKGMVVKKQGIQVFAQGIICLEFKGHDVFSRGNLIIVYFQVPNNGNVVPKGDIGLKVQIAI